VLAGETQATDQLRRGETARLEADSHRLEGAPRCNNELPHTFPRGRSRKNTYLTPDPYFSVYFSIYLGSKRRRE
jgi:hypothetical protein